MIAFDLKCSRGHIFEGWFQNNHSFEKQNSKKLVSCPFAATRRSAGSSPPVATRISPREEPSKEAIAIDYGRLAKEVVEYVKRISMTWAMISLKRLSKCITA